eukprot:scaffold3964_cov126-Isochrysis_galbana.AAC.10
MLWLCGCDYVTPARRQPFPLTCPLAPACACGLCVGVGVGVWGGRGGEIRGVAGRGGVHGYGCTCRRGCTRGHKQAQQEAEDNRLSSPSASVTADAGRQLARSAPDSSSRLPGMRAPRFNDNSPIARTPGQRWPTSPDISACNCVRTALRWAVAGE